MCVKIHVMVCDVVMKFVCVCAVLQCVDHYCGQGADNLRESYVISNLNLSTWL